MIRKGLLLGVFVGLICIVGWEKQSHIKLSSQEIEVAIRQIAEDEEVLLPFPPERIWRANQLLQNVLSLKCLETSAPKVAAKAHRLMAGVYFAASMIVGPPIPILSNEQREIHKAVKELGQEGGWEKAVKHIKKSLRLDPTQKDSSELREAIIVLKGKSIPLARLGEIIDLLMKPSRYKSSQKHPQ